MHLPPRGVDRHPTQSSRVSFVSLVPLESEQAVTSANALMAILPSCVRDIGVAISVAPLRSSASFAYHIARRNDIQWWGSARKTYAPPSG